MKPVVSAVVSYHDLKEYFAGNSWSFQIQDDGSIVAQSEAYDLKLKQKPSKYDVTITATDDPSDSESSTTDDPVKFITKFLSTGTEADDLLKKMSFVPDPKFISIILRRAALMTEVAGDVPAVKRLLRRSIVAAYGPGLDRLLVAVVRAVAGAGDDALEVQKVTKDMKSKGWKVSQEDGEDGRPVLKVDVSGIYEAEVRARDTVWDYSFQVKGIDESKEEGTTDDPIQKFRVFYKKDSTQEFKQQLKEKLKSNKGEEATDQTVKPGGQKSGKKEEKKPTGPPADGTESTLFAPTQLPPSSHTHNIPRSNKHSED